MTFCLGYYFSKSIIILTPSLLCGEGSLGADNLWGMPACSVPCIQGDGGGGREKAPFLVWIREGGVAVGGGQCWCEEGALLWSGRGAPLCHSHGAGKEPFHGRLSGSPTGPPLRLEGGHRHPPPFSEPLHATLQLLSSRAESLYLPTNQLDPFWAIGQ